MLAQDDLMVWKLASLGVTDRNSANVSLCSFGLLHENVTRLDVKL